MDKNNLIQSLVRIEKEPSLNSYMAAANILDSMSLKDSGLPEIRLAVLRNFTFEPLLAVIKPEIARMGFFPQVYLGEYDTVASDAMNPKSNFYSFNPDFIILAQWLQLLSPRLTSRFLSFSKDEVTKEVERLLCAQMDILANIRKHSQAPIFMNNFPIPDYVALGILDTQSKDLELNTLRRINQELLERCRKFADVYMVDYAYLMNRLGYQNGFDERYWHIGRSPISRQALIPFGLEYTRFLRALKGKAHKCLILDCDNTLWGGVVGEDGLEGIKLGLSYPGSCYMAFQSEILNLHDKGVILALASKNNQEDVFEVLEKHPHMLLKKEHFAAWQINWLDKAANIKKIAADLNIGMDSVVFVDESEYEIGLVRAQLPEVTALKLPQEPSQFRANLLKNCYFDILSFSHEDRQRNKMYREEAKRKELYGEARSLEEYLAQLEIHARIKVPDNFSIGRVAQLTQKTNQFNLTTKRYTEAQIAEFVKDPHWDVWCVEVKDKISELGIVGLAIVQYQGVIAHIDSFLLSCRALGRGVEDALYAQIASYIQSKGFKTLRGTYLVTAKNAQVADFFKIRGFKQIAGQDKKSDWELNLKGVSFKAPNWVTITSE